jgi:hypothetical protein
MALILPDRVKVRSTTSGTGTFTLTTVMEGFRGFSAVGDGNETYYGIVDYSGHWEIGRGTWHSSSNTLSRDTVISSSNSNNKVNFPAGGKIVYSTFPSSLAQSIFSSTSTDSFSTISVAGQSDLNADSSTDTLTIVAGAGIELTTNPSTDTLTITSSAADTGSITFADINIYGATSMDFANGGITLVPNQNSLFTDMGQYLDIYPTTDQDAPHIHIAAGKGSGSTGDLLLGDDNQYVNIHHDGTIHIQTNDRTRGWTNHWTFETNGSLSHNGPLYVDNGIESSYGNTLYLNGSYFDQSTVFVQFSNADGTARTTYTVDGNTYNLSGILNPNVGGSTVYDNGTQYYPSNIANDSGTNVWTFTFDSAITLEAGTAYTLDWWYYSPQPVQINGGENSWVFNPAGNFVQNNVSTQATYDSTVSGGSQSAVIFSSPNYNAGMKLVLKIEGRLDGDSSYVDHTQIAEAVVAWSYNTTSEPVMSVYGVVHTSPEPLVTFTVQRNTVSNTIEIVAANSQTSNAMYVAVHAVQFGSHYD